MSDIVERLADLLTAALAPYQRAVIEDAKTEIERLRADNDVLSAAYAEISTIIGRRGTEEESLANQVRAALKGSGGLR